MASLFGYEGKRVVVTGGATGIGASLIDLLKELGAPHVTVLDKDINALQHIYERFPTVVTMISTKRNIEKATAYADVVIGAVLVSAERAPILLTRDMVRAMKERSVLIDVSIDQGGISETSRPTTHERPTYIDEGVIHYCVPNIPGIVARTATHAFVNCAMPYLIEIANRGVEEAIQSDPALELAVNTHQGQLVHLKLLADGGPHGLE